MQVQSLHGDFINYTYTEVRTYEDIDDRFLQSTFKALDFLIRTNALTIQFQGEDELKRVDIMDVLVADTVHNISIVHGKRNAYNHRLNSIMFLDIHGAVFRKNHKKKCNRRNKGCNSPVALLSHELIHCYNELYENDD